MSPHGKAIDVTALKSQIDFVALVSQYLHLQQTGDKWAAICPFHEDNDPSLIVYNDHAFCFGGCRRSYDAISFVQEMEGLSFLAAVDWLRERVGDIPYVEREDSPASYTYPTDPLRRDNIDYWYGLLTDDLRTWYHDRLLDNSTIDTFMLGWDGRSYVTPIWEGAPRESEVFSVKLRHLEGKPKYTNLKGRGAPRLFNKYVLQGATEACIFIGEYDTMLAHQDGFIAVSGTGGQSTWRPEWNELFVTCKTIYVVPDVGELAAGYAVASQFPNRAHVAAYPQGAGDDYTDFRRNLSADDFRFFVLTPSLHETSKPDMELYWEEE